MTTPTRRALKSASRLQALIRDGLEAIEKRDKKLIDTSLRGAFSDSLGLDEALREGNEQSHRWDYLLGIEELDVVVGLEPHGAKDREISVLIAKKRAALEQLRGHLNAGYRIAAWYWVQSSGGGFLDTERARRQADQEGITFVGRSLRTKDIEPLRRAKTRR